MKELELSHIKEELIEFTGKKKGSTLYCRECGTRKLYVIQEGWNTFVKCPKCHKFVLIHSG